MARAARLSPRAKGQGGPRWRVKRQGSPADDLRGAVTLAMGSAFRRHGPAWPTGGRNDPLWRRAQICGTRADSGPSHRAGFAIISAWLASLFFKRSVSARLSGFSRDGAFEPSRLCGWASRAGHMHPPKSSVSAGSRLDYVRNHRRILPRTRYAIRRSVTHPSPPSPLPSLSSWAATAQPAVGGLRSTRSYSVFISHTR